MQPPCTPNTSPPCTSHMATTSHAPQCSSTMHHLANHLHSASPSPPTMMPLSRIMVSMKLGYANNHPLPRFDTLPTQICGGSGHDTASDTLLPAGHGQHLRHVFKTRLIVTGHTFFFQNHKINVFFTKITKSTQE